jgi:hypothetical protein
LDELKLLFSSINYCDSNNDGLKLIAIDGMNNNDDNRNVALNMGYFDIENNVPLDLTFHGNENRNKEIKMLRDKIINEPEFFKNSLLVLDRFYFSYDLIDFLIKKNIKFIIRVKKTGDNLNPNTKLKKNIKNYSVISSIRQNVHIVNGKCILNKTYRIKNRKTNKFENIDVKEQSDCILVTNLSKQFSDNEILEKYKSRWSVEIFFKRIKNGFKSQHLNEKSVNRYEKLYVCELILIYIAEIIKISYLKELKINTKVKTKRNKKNGKIVDCTVKINEENLMKGICNELLKYIISGKLTMEIINKFCKSYIKIIKNETDRHFERISKTPFTKWYLKGYSQMSQMTKIITAIINKTLNKLNKNLKLKAKKIIEIIKE